MGRTLAVGSGSALDSARRVASASAEEAARSVVVATAEPSRAIPGALAWLAQQRGMHELVLVSDFQLGALDSSALAAVPDNYGVRLVRVASRALDSSFTIRGGDGTTNVRVTPLADRTVFSWQRVSNADSTVVAAPKSELVLLGGESERDGAVAALNAAVGVQARAAALADRFRTALPSARAAGDSSAARDVRVVYPGFAERAALLARATLPSRPWMSELVVELRKDRLLQEVAHDDSRGAVAAARNAAAAAGDTAGMSDGDSARFVIARNASGAAVVFAAQGERRWRRIDALRQRRRRQPHVRSAFGGDEPSAGLGRTDVGTRTAHRERRRLAALVASCSGFGECGRPPTL